MVCGTKAAAPVIGLPAFPLTEIYVEQKVTEKLGFVDQAFHLCPRCGHGQIANVIDRNVLYGESYATRTSTSPSAIGAIDAFLEFVDGVTKDRPIKNVMEVGCNDLYTLRRLKDRAEKLYGIDPILIGRESEFTDDKIEAIGDFVENVDLRERNIEADIVLSSHTLEHIEDPKKLVRFLIDNAGDDALFFFQFPGLESLVETARFDQVFHQHLNYFTLQSVLHMLEDTGAELIDYGINPYHWGALMIAFRRKGNNVGTGGNFNRAVTGLTESQIREQYRLFKDGMDVTGRRIAALRNETIYGYGASLMLPVLGYYVPVINDFTCIIDDDTNKDGLYYINLPLRVVNSSKIDNIKDAVVCVTAINSKQPLRAVVSRLIDIGVKEIIIPANLI